jgi:hypothetical protein
MKKSIFITLFVLLSVLSCLCDTASVSVSVSVGDNHHELEEGYMRPFNPQFVPKQNSEKLLVSSPAPSTKPAKGKSTPTADPTSPPIAPAGSKNWGSCTSKFGEKGTCMKSPNCKWGATHGILCPGGADILCCLPRQQSIISPRTLPDKPLLKYGIHPAASNALRAIGMPLDRLWQTIGSASASAGTHAIDGYTDTHGHAPYACCLDLKTEDLTTDEQNNLMERLASIGYAAWQRIPGKNGWPSSEINHIHAVFVGAKCKSIVQSQVRDWLATPHKDGLAYHTIYTQWSPSPELKEHVRKMFETFN